MNWKFWKKDAATEQPDESILNDDEKAYIKACKAEGRKDTLRAVGKGLLVGAAIGAAAGCAYAYAQSRSEGSGGSTEPTTPTPEQQEDLLAEMPADMMTDLGV